MLAEVDTLCAAADAAFDTYRESDLQLRAAFLDRIGEEILSLGDRLVSTDCRESNLPQARLEGERERTVSQLHMFAEVVRRGDWLGLRADSPLPDRRPAPRPALRTRHIPLGPVAVFGASNFPLAFSTAGGDTASALAAGCPVIVKAHEAHPQTSNLVADAIRIAADAHGLPSGVFGHIVGVGNALGEALVTNNHIAAVGFTGSRSGGLSLLRLAQARRVPIPVYAEMSSINPVILLPHALAARADPLGVEFVASLTLGAGQFCTNPGWVLGIDGPDLDAFLASASRALQNCPATKMLTPGISAAYADGVAALAAHPMVQLFASGQESQSAGCCQPHLFAVRAVTVLADSLLSREVFGATSLVVRCTDPGELRAVLGAAEGQLTATLQLEPADFALARSLLPVLERKAGRIITNGWPTGVELGEAQIHGGPYPATSDSRTTSVGTMAIQRFLRPVCYQNFVSEMLPPLARG